MSNYLEDIKGGIFITWNIEDFLGIERHWENYCHFDWVKPNSTWQVKLAFSSKLKNEKYIYITIKSSDKQESFDLQGTITVINENSSSEIVWYRFPTRGNTSLRKTMNMWRTRYIDFENEGLLHDKSLVLHFKFWEHKINDKVAVEYVFRSTNIRECNYFSWTLQGKRDCGENIVSLQNTSECLEYFTHINTMNTFKFDLFLEIDEDKLFVNINPVDLEWEEDFFIYGSCNVKISEDNKRYRNPQLSTDFKFTLSSRLNIHRHLIAKDIFDMGSCIVGINLETDMYSTITEKVCYKPNILKKEEVTSKRNEFPKNQLKHSIHSLYKDSKFCDVILRMNNESFPCHKAVLCARSTVFQTMFENNMIEKETGIVNIDDIESQILVKFLDFLYLDNLEDKEFDLAVKLYAIADKYVVENLKETCKSIIVSCLSTENVCEMLELADLHQDKDLMEEILSYFLEHSKKIVNSPSWQRLLVNKPSLATEACHYASIKMGNTSKRIKLN